MGTIEGYISRGRIWRWNILIFVSTGSRKFQFDRLLKELDSLIDRGIIQDTVFAQIAESSYVPKNYEYKRYLSPKEFSAYQTEAFLIISHAGTGALISALKKGKQVIAVPRLAKYGEHSDDHQTQISGVLAKEGYLREVLEMDKLGETIDLTYKNPIIKKYDKPSNIISIIDEFLNT